MKLYFVTALAAFAWLAVAPELTGVSALNVCVMTYTAATLAVVPWVAKAAAAYVESERRWVNRLSKIEERDERWDKDGFE